MCVVTVRQWGEEGVVVELQGEFDCHNLEDLRDTLSGALALRRPTLLDLSRVTFMDLETTRELAVRYQLYAHHLVLCEPSQAVRASVSACGLEPWFNFVDDPGGTAGEEEIMTRASGELPEHPLP